MEPPKPRLRCFKDVYADAKEKAGDLAGKAGEKYAELRDKAEDLVDETRAKFTKKDSEEA